MILPSASLASLVLTLAAAVAYVAPTVWAARMHQEAARSVLMVAWLLHGLTLVWGLVGEEPHFGWAQALSFTAWLVLTIYVIERQMLPQLRSRLALTGLGALALVPPLFFQGRPLHVDGPWLPIHLALGIAAYGMVAAAVVHAWLMGRAEQQIRLAAEASSGVPLLTLERLTFRFTSVGFLLLSLTLVAGLVSGGWRWDHKTVLTSAAWLVFALLVVGRLRFGWRGRKAVRVLYAGSFLLLLAYAGSRFVLEVLLGRTA